MKEQLVSFDTAKLAKEKGFDWECRDFWNPTQDNKLKEDALLENYNEKHNISAPTQSLLQKWLREKHNIHIWVELGSYSTTRKVVKEFKVYNFDWVNGERFWNEYTYEEALEKGLQEALKLIK